MNDCLFSAKASDIALPTARFGFGGGGQSGDFGSPSQVFGKCARTLHSTLNSALARRIIAIALIFIMLTALIVGIAVAVENAPKPAPKGMQSASNSSTTDAPDATSSTSSGSTSTPSTSTSSPPAASPPAASPPAAPAAPPPTPRSVDCTVKAQSSCTKTGYQWKSLQAYTHDQTGCYSQCPGDPMLSMECCAYIPSGTVLCGAIGAATCQMYSGVTWGDPTSANGKACGEQCSNLRRQVLPGGTSCCYTT